MAKTAAFYLRLALENTIHTVPIGGLFKLSIDSIPDNIFDVFADTMEFAESLDCRYLRFGDKMLSLRGTHRLYEEITFKVWKLGAWSTTRIDAMEKMTPERAKHWLGE